MITGINESNILTKQVSCKCKYKFDNKTYNSNQNWNNNKSRCKCKNLNKDRVWKKIKFRNLLHIVVKIVNMKEVFLMIQ